MGRLLVLDSRVQPSLILHELIVYSLLLSHLLIGNRDLCVIFLLLHFAVALELCDRLTAINSLHLAVSIDDKQDGRVRVQEFDEADLNLELPELDQVLRARELEKQDAVLLGLASLDRLIS